MEDFATRFFRGLEAGRASRQAQEDRSRELELHELRLKALKQQMDSEKFAQELRKRQLTTEHLGLAPVGRIAAPGAGATTQFESQEPRAIPDALRELVSPEVGPESPVASALRRPVPLAPIGPSAGGLAKPIQELVRQRYFPGMEQVEVPDVGGMGLGYTTSPAEFQEAGMRRSAEQAALKAQMEPFTLTAPAGGSSARFAGGSLLARLQGQPRQDTSVSEIELSERAARGDQVADAALKRLNQSRLASRPVTNVNVGNKPLTKTQIFNQELQLSNQLRNQLKDWNIPQLSTAAASIRTFGDRAIKEGSGAATDAVIIAFNKMIDSGSVVRESEFARTLQVGSLADRLQGMVSRITTGQRLAPNVIRDLVQTATALGVEIDKARKSAEDHYGSLATEFGLKPERVTGRGPSIGSGVKILKVEEVK